MRRLGGVEWPRIRYWRSADLVPDIGVEANNFVLLGQSWFFRRPEFMADVLDITRVQLDVDRATWHRQKQFLISYACSHYDSSDRPAWMMVTSARKGFARRSQDAGARPTHAARLVARAIGLNDLRGSTITLNGMPLSMRGFLPIHPFVTGAQVQLQRVSIVRSVRNKRGPLAAPEDRLVTVSGDPEDFKLASKGITPALELYRGHNDVHKSPLITFCILDKQGQVRCRNFSVHPTIGYVGDVRASVYDPEYYLRSDMLNHTVLEKLITPGAHEAFYAGRR